MGETSKQIALVRGVKLKAQITELALQIDDPADIADHLGVSEEIVRDTLRKAYSDWKLRLIEDTAALKAKLYQRLEDTYQKVQPHAVGYTADDGTVVPPDYRLIPALLKVVEQQYKMLAAQEALALKEAERERKENDGVGGILPAISSASDVYASALANETIASYLNKIPGQAVASTIEFTDVPATATKANPLPPVKTVQEVEKALENVGD